MSRFTHGRISVTPAKMKFPSDHSLEDILAAAERLAYRGDSERASSGWGSSQDDDAVVDAEVLANLSVERPEILEASVRTDRPDAILPRRLRARYYWDELYKPYLRSQGATADWKRTHVRRAVDVVIFDDQTDAGRSVLISTRTTRPLNSFAIPAIRKLAEECDPAGSVSVDALGESLDPDFFLWLLYKLQDEENRVGDLIELQTILEISSRDRLLRGARFTDKASFERIELAALITLGKTKFGPAKLGLDVEDLEAFFHVELCLDGGFNVFRDGTDYNTVEPIAKEAAGHIFSEDLWAIVLPRLRREYNGDDHWRAEGRDHLTRLAVGAIRAILPPDDEVPPSPVSA